ncbi:hypothetical protein SRHO_G00169690 [Serrasalmus rhombeus]
MRQQDLGHCAALICPPEPNTLFKINEPTLKEVREVIKSARTASAPGPSGVPYKVFKNCPRLLECLWKIYRVIWRKGKVPQQCRYAEGTNDNLNTWLWAVDKSGLPGKFKAWIYQHDILPHLLWLLLVYEVLITIMEGFKRKISQFLLSLAEEFKVIRASEVLLYRDSTNTKVSSADVEIRTGRKWCAQDAVEWEEARLQHSDLVGTVVSGRAGLGSILKSSYSKASGKDLLATARDWQLLVDLVRQLRFPDIIAATTLRPDIVLMSRATKQVVLLELTVPWEDRIEEAQVRKKAKYVDLVAECWRNGWKARYKPIEVGCWSFAGQSLYWALGLLGICRLHRRRAMKNIMEAAEKAS